MVHVLHRYTRVAIYSMCQGSPPWQRPPHLTSVHLTRGQIVPCILQSTCLISLCSTSLFQWWAPLNGVADSATDDGRDRRWVVHNVDLKHQQSESKLNLADGIILHDTRSFFSPKLVHQRAPHEIIHDLQRSSTCDSKTAFESFQHASMLSKPQQDTQHACQ